MVLTIVQAAVERRIIEELKANNYWRAMKK